jgi:hypothetical protein
MFREDTDGANRLESLKKSWLQCKGICAKATNQSLTFAGATPSL